MNKYILVEGEFGHGAIKNKVDLCDRKWHKLAAASAPFDWNLSYDVENELSQKLNITGFKIPVKNQGASLSCCGQASAYYESVQDAFEKGVYSEKSARDSYSQIFYPGGGSSTRDALNLLIKKGVCREPLMVSYDNNQPPSESFIEKRLDVSQTTVSDAFTSKGTAYASVRLDTDTMAQAIRDNHGMLITIDGQNNGTWRSAFPLPPAVTEWSHELYVGKAKMINGKKYLGVLNSWGVDCGESGWQWIGIEYLNFIHSTGVLYDTQNDALNQEKSLLEQVLELLQRLINSFGYQTKRTLSGML